MSANATSVMKTGDDPDPTMRLHDDPIWEASVIRRPRPSSALRNACGLSPLAPPPTRRACPRARAVRHVPDLLGLRRRRVLQPIDTLTDQQLVPSRSSR